MARLSSPGDKNLASQNIEIKKNTFEVSCLNILYKNKGVRKEARKKKKKNCYESGILEWGQMIWKQIELYDLGSVKYFTTGHFCW